MRDREIDRTADAPKVADSSSSHLSYDHHGGADDRAERTHLRAASPSTAAAHMPDFELSHERRPTVDHLKLGFTGRPSALEDGIAQLNHEGHSKPYAQFHKELVSLNSQLKDVLPAVSTASGRAEKLAIMGTTADAGHSGLVLAADIPDQGEAKQVVILTGQGKYVEAERTDKGFVAKENGAEYFKGSDGVLTEKPIHSHVVPDGHPSKLDDFFGFSRTGYEQRKSHQPLLPNPLDLVPDCWGVRARRQARENPPFGGRIPHYEMPRFGHAEINLPRQFGPVRIPFVTLPGRVTVPVEPSRPSSSSDHPAPSMTSENPSAVSEAPVKVSEGSYINVTPQERRR